MQTVWSKNIRGWQNAVWIAVSLKIQSNDCWMVNCKRNELTSINQWKSTLDWQIICFQRCNQVQSVFNEHSFVQIACSQMCGFSSSPNVYAGLFFEQTVFINEAAFKLIFWNIDRRESTYIDFTFLFETPYESKFKRFKIN